MAGLIDFAERGDYEVISAFSANVSDAKANRIENRIENGKVMDLAKA